MPLHLREDFRPDLACLAPELAAHLGAGQPAGAAQVDALHRALARAKAKVYRQAAARRTIRLTAPGGDYFAKLHEGVGWLEIGKNLLTFKRPVLGARDEFVACRRLRAHGVPAPRVAAFGACGRNPARRRSFLVCDAFAGFASLEELAHSAHATPLSRRRVAVAAGALLRAMHDAGVQHRDCYAAHILVDTAALANGRVELAVIDLHRARVRDRLPERWRRRDLAALLFSTGGLRPRRGELLRFAAAYAGENTWRRHHRFWRGVLRRTRRLRLRSARRGRPAAGTNAEGGEAVPSVADFHKLAAAPATPFRFDVDLPAGPVRARCETVLCWHPKRGFTAEVTIGGVDHLLRAYFGVGHARRFRRARRAARRRAAAGTGLEVRDTGRSAGARFILHAAPTSRRADPAAETGIESA